MVASIRYSLIALVLFELRTQSFWAIRIGSQHNDLQSAKNQQICLQSFVFLLEVTSVCLLMQMEVFGAVDTIDMDDWDWEMRTTEMFQNKSQTFQKSNQQLHLVSHQYFLIAKDQFGPVGIMKTGNWDWDTQ